MEAVETIEKAAPGGPVWSPDTSRVDGWPVSGVVSSLSVSLRTDDAARLRTGAQRSIKRIALPHARPRLPRPLNVRRPAPVQKDGAFARMTPARCLHAPSLNVLSSCCSASEGPQATDAENSVAWQAVVPGAQVEELAKESNAWSANSRCIVREAQIRCPS